ncbi:GNAT family N-acetyltransferase [Halomicroarcula sp. GCM10025324]|uniref:GNAT family N-acetyltransferase n=1 Tax=Haloarcula TaxID=2237 RepID=UPI0023E7CED3|nr:GNAT family N-acetyltransferase [Halomicroarcula sp. ZS-22-S1]
MSSYVLHSGTDAELGDAAREVRQAVFVDEQGVPESEEMDGKDEVATHFVITHDETPVATARTRFIDDATVKVERVAVLDSHRGEGLGKRVMAAAERAAREAGATTALLHGQRHVESFYTGLGYETVGEEFEEAGIPHVEMVKPLDAE